MKLLRQISFLLALTAIMFSGCKNHETSNIFNIGVIAPLTGEGARYGEAMKYGIDLALEDLNSKGGYNNDTIKATYADDKFDVNEALKGLNYLSDVIKVPIIFGPAASGVSKALIPNANEKKIVLFSSISTSDALTGKSDYFFRNISSNSMQANSVADFLVNNLTIKNIGVFYENNEYGINMNTVFKGQFKGGIVFDLPYEFKQSDFRNAILSIKDKKFDAIFIQGTTWGIANLIKQLRQYDINCAVITGDGGYGDEITSIAGKAANGLYCTLPAVLDTLSNEYMSFKSRFISNYKKEPDIYSIYSYDAVMMVFDALKKEEKDKITGEFIKEKLLQTTYKGLGGTYKFDNFGDVSIPFCIFQYKDGSYSRVK